MRALVLARLTTLLEDSDGEGLLTDFDDTTPRILTATALDAMSDSALLHVLELNVAFQG
jgi:hypothetical protein